MINSTTWLIQRRLTLRFKVLLFVGIIVLSIFLIFQIIASSYIQKGFEKIETDDAHEDVERTLQGVSAEYAYLNSKSSDWAVWDNAYQFVQDKNAAFIKANLPVSVFGQLGLNVIIFAKNSGTIVWSGEVHEGDNKITVISTWWSKNIYPDSPLLQLNIDQKLNGILMVDNQPMIITSRPILTSEGGGPVAGTLVFGRYLDNLEVAKLADMQKYPLLFNNFDGDLPPDFQLAKSKLNQSGSVFVNARNERDLYGYALLDDVFGKPALILREQMSREISQYGLSIIHIFRVLLITFGSLALLSITFILEKEVLQRLSSLQSDVKKIGTEGSPSARVNRLGNDELGDLANNVNETLEKLEIVSREKAYEESQKKSILDTIGEGVVITDETKSITYINPVFEQLLGYTPDELKGKLFAQTLAAYDFQGNRLQDDYLTYSATVTPKTTEFKVLLAGKTKKVPVIINMAPIIARGVFVGVVRIIYDYSKELELQKQKDDFFSIASHELKTPLTVIAGNTDNILQGYGKSSLSEVDIQELKDVSLSADRLLTLVNDFLNVSRIDQGRVKLEIKPIIVGNLIDKVGKEMEPLFRSRGLQFQAIDKKEHNPVLADEMKLREILVNLIGNSLKFTKKGGTITVSHSVGDGMLITQVSDTGIGIASDKQHLLFSRFQQAMEKTLSRDAGGTGLGLYISREFARLMGGDLWLVKSELEKGSTFAFSLPLAP